MREIVLTRGYVTQVDDNAFNSLCRRKWYAKNRGSGGVVAACNMTIGGKRRTVFMHRLLMKAKHGQQIDHRDLNPLNNQVENLRMATNSQNCSNRGINSTNTSGFKGVGWDRRYSNWVARIKFLQRPIYIGAFKTAEAAAKAYDQAALKLHGDFARLNFPQ